jgi:serine phosphatase RsbU (regulator of sigma subunit)
MAHRATIDGIGCLIATAGGYILFITFIQRQGARQVRIATEIALAKEIHSALAPPIALATRRFECCGRSVPSSEVGGDLLDAIELEDGVLGVVPTSPATASMPAR